MTKRERRYFKDRIVTKCSGGYTITMYKDKISGFKKDVKSNWGIFIPNECVDVELKPEYRYKGLIMIHLV